MQPLPGLPPFSQQGSTPRAAAARPPTCQPAVTPPSQPAWARVPPAQAIVTASLLSLLGFPAFRTLRLLRVLRPLRLISRFGNLRIVVDLFIKTLPQV